MRQQTIKNILRTSRFVLCLSLSTVPVLALPETGADKSESVPANAVYLQAVPGLNIDQRREFHAGEKVFNTFWIAIYNKLIANWDFSRPGPGGGEWGLGPTYLATSCVACHVQGGRGSAGDGNGNQVFQQLLRLSVPGENPHGGPKPDPHYGGQLQSFDAIQRADETQRAGEGNLHVDWKRSVFALGDGTTVPLRQPVIRLEKLNFGPLGEGSMHSLRNAQAMFGLGYLEAISESDIFALAERQKSQGLNGRPNLVRDDINDRMAMGRFGWKANQPNIKQQIAAALLNDVGITSTVYPTQNCPSIQKECLATYHTGKPEIRDDLWQAINFWLLALDVPAQRDIHKPEVQRGAKLFEAARCAQCHVTELRTGTFEALPLISNQTIHPYTDLLLHDMGPDLADGRPDFRAGGADWRTPPLWGIGLSKQVNGSTSFLHDGRARNVLEAILWHGGEAKPSRDLFAGMSKAERADLIAFVNSL